MNILEKRRSSRLKRLTFIFSVILVAAFLLSTATPAYAFYTGTVYQNNYIRIGINDYGALGVYDSDYNEVGFQYPIGSAYESLATGWWGEGWSLFYEGDRVGYAPDDDIWGTVSLSTPVIVSQNLGYKTVHQIVLKTSDNRVKITFTYTIYNNEKFVILRTAIENIGMTTLYELEHKRIVDWDVWVNYGGGYTNYWGMDDIRRPDLHLTVAFKNSTLVGSVSPNTVYMGFASTRGPSDYDHDWDDYTSRGFVNPEHFSIRADGTTAYRGDYCVVYDWRLGDLKPGKEIVLYQVYAAGDSLRELENNVQKAFNLIYGKVIKATGIASVGNMERGRDFGLATLQLNKVLMTGKLDMLMLTAAPAKPISFEMVLSSYNEYNDVIYIKGKMIVDGKLVATTILIFKDTGKVTLSSGTVFFTGRLTG